MLWSIIVWALMAWGCGWFVDTLFEPTQTWQIWALYALPFCAFGFLYQRRILKRYSLWRLRPLFSTASQYRRLTFWGIPVRKEELIDEDRTRAGEGLLPVVLTSPNRAKSTRRSVQAAFRQLSKHDIRRIEKHLNSSAKGSTFVSSAITAGKMGGHWFGSLLLLLTAQLRLAAKLALFGVLCAIGVWIFLPNKAQLTDIAGNVQLKLKADNGRIVLLDVVNDLYVPLEKIPPHFYDALVFREDRRFYDHWGFDWRGKGRAVYQTGRYVLNRILRRSNGGVQGGSTITQQLAKNLFLSTESSLIRKFRELVLAFKLEWYFSKNEILEMYLNKIFFGPRIGSYGIEVAARSYFRKSAEHLNLYESAVLIQSIPSPFRFNFSRDEQLARKRAAAFLDTLVSQGAIRLGERNVEFTKSHVKQAIGQGVQYGQRTLKQRETRYLFDWIRSQIESAAYFPHLRGEFTVVTTLNSEMQIYAEEAVRQVLTDAVQRDRRASQVALVAMTPDGAVRALLGGHDYAESQFRRATLAQRQPGSTFKMFVYLSALEQGWKPGDNIEDLPVSIGPKEITNFDGKFLGAISLTKALALSRNAAAVNLIQQPKIGPQGVIDTARRLGITADLYENPGLALGISEVTLLELTGAYSVLANKGFESTPYGIVGVRTKRGNVRYWHSPTRLQLFDRIDVTLPIVKKSDVSAMNAMLQAVVNDPRGTGRNAKFGTAGDHHAIAGKTGTTNDYRDAWFVGFSAHLCTGVWIGNDDNTPMRRVGGGSLPVDVFREFMQHTHEYLSLEPRPLP